MTPGATQTSQAAPGVEGTAAPSGLEARLIERLRAGDNAAFEALVLQAGGRMLSVARRMMRTEEDAQDAVQDAFLSAFKSLDRFDGRSQLATWLHRITINACLMKLRSQRRRPERSIEDLLPTFLSDGHQTRSTVAWQPTHGCGIERSESLALVRAKIGELPEPFREALILRDIEGLSTEAAAEALGITTAAVKTRLHRARQALRTLLDQQFSAERAQGIP